MKKEGSVSKDLEGELNENEGEEVNSLALQKSILAKVNSLMDVMEKLTRIEASMFFLANNYDALLSKVNGLREDSNKLKKEVHASKANGLP